MSRSEAALILKNNAPRGRGRRGNASTLPLTWLIQADGSLFGYDVGALEKDQMLLIRKTLDPSAE